MKIHLAIALIAIMSFACSSEENSGNEQPQANDHYEMVFDKDLWNQMDDGKYVFRDRMMNDVVYNDTIRSLNREQLTEILGQPDKEVDAHLYYTIDRTGVGAFTLHKKTMVIKLKEDGSVEWIKIHE